MSGKYQKKRRPPKISRRALVVLVAAFLSAVLAVVCFSRLHSVTTCLYTQQAAERWRGESELRFSQVSVFLPAAEGTDQTAIESFHSAIDTAMQDVSLEAAEGGRLYADAYCGAKQLQVSTEHGSAQVETLGVGGDFFLFHPLTLRSGSYLTGTDYMADRVMLDEALAWQLFGSYDVAGQQVMIGDRPYLIAGVVAREDDYASKKAYSGEAGMFMSFDALNAIEQTKINCYEVVMPDPISGYARSVVEKTFSPETNVVVENTTRYDFLNLVGVLGDFGERSMQTYAVIYPYWENAARMTEDHAALALLFGVLLSVLPVGVALFWAVHWGKKGFIAAKERTVTSIEKKVEENKEKHYVAGGI